MTEHDIPDDNPDDDPNNWAECPDCGGVGLSDEDGSWCECCDGRGGVSRTATKETA